METALGTAHFSPDLLSAKLRESAFDLRESAAPNPASARQMSNGTLEVQNPEARFEMSITAYPIARSSFGPLQLH